MTGSPAGYYDVVHPQTWARRTAAFLAGATIGTAGGAYLGVIASIVMPAVMVALGVVATAPVIPFLSTVALFAATGSLIGLGAVAAVGASAGAVAAGFEEHEKRIALSGAGGPAQAQARTPVKAPEAATNNSLFNWRVAATMMPITAAFGALLGFAPMALAVSLLGFKAGTAAAVTASAGDGGVRRANRV